jgi:hypothetical protein
VKEREDPALMDTVVVFAPEAPPALQIRSLEVRSVTGEL